MRRDNQRLQDILDGLDSVARMIDGKTETDFLRDELVFYAVARGLTVVCEADSQQAEFPE
jgi:uncharacterized protein with HEPN domain